ncbi:MAG: Na/Pi symporter [Terrimicrobiaceae bacterium]|nr:Na/Pi symporter [Terrimicrobiaceae bacterium]
MESAALFLAGLSLFFSGVSGVRAKLQQAAGRRIRAWLAGLTNRPVLVGLVGLIAGAVTQSASAVAFILSGMVATGLITLRRALPVVATSNVGTALLVFLAAVDLRLAVLYLIGVTGLMINFRLATRFEALTGALFAIGLLFFGLDLMKRAFEPLPELAWFQSLAMFLREWPFAPFILGAVCRMFIQSSSAIGVIAITLEDAGLFSEMQAMLLVCGTGPGVALASLFLSSNLTGTPRQIIIYQGLINLVSGVVVGTLIAMDAFTGFNAVTRVLDLVGDDSGKRLAWVFLANMVGCLLVGLAVLPRIEPWLRRLAPPSEEQNLACPRFLHDEALTVPETAAELVDREQRRFFELCISLLDTVREEGAGEYRGQPDVFHSAAGGLHGEIRAFLADLLSRSLTNETMLDVLNLERRQDTLQSIEESLDRLVRISLKTRPDSPSAAVIERLVESLSLILLTAREAWTTGEDVERVYLLALTDDRSEMMERIRRSFQDGGPAITSDERSALFYATTLFERAVWLLRQLGLTLGPKPLE